MIEGQPDHAEALVYRGLALMGKGETGRTLTDFNRAAINRPGGFAPLLLGNRGQC